MIASWLGAKQDGRRKRENTRRPEFESHTEPITSFNHSDNFRYNVSSFDFFALNDTKSRDTTSVSKNASSRRLTSSNGRYVQQQMILDSPHRYRHHGHAQHPIEQHPPPSSMSISYRMQSAAGVGVIAGVFFCLTLFATLALGVFCRKRNSIFAFQTTNSSEQVDYSSTMPNDDEEADWLGTFNDDACDCDETTGSERRRLSGELVMIDDETSCDTSPSHDADGEGRTRLVETRFERSVERSKENEKRRRGKNTNYTFASENDELRREHINHVRQFSSQRSVAKRPVTLAIPIVNPPKENGNDSDTKGLYFRTGLGCEVTNVTPSAVDKIAELSTTSSLLSTVFRDSISVSTLLTGEVNFDDVSVVSYRSQRPGYERIGSSPDVPQTAAAAQRQASEMLQQQLDSGHVFTVT